MYDPYMYSVYVQLYTYMYSVYDESSCFTKNVKTSQWYRNQYELMNWY